MAFSLWSYTVVRVRFSLTLFTAALAVIPATAGPGLFGNKPAPDAGRARALVETLKNDPDERKRKAAATELGLADGRVITEVAPALVAALQKDTSAAVRAAAADGLGQLNQIVPAAGKALETAVAGDPSPAVRQAAKKALWEYHLNGYFSPKGVDGLMAQTVEPPIASPAGVRRVAAAVPAPPPPVPTYIAPLPAEPPVRVSQLPQIVPPIGPRITWPSLLGAMQPGTRAVRTLAGATPPPILNVTGEPPIAKPVASALPISIPTTYVPTLIIDVKPTEPVEPPVPNYPPTLSFVPDLPPVVIPPDAAPTAPNPVAAKIPATLPPLPKR